MKYSEPSCVDPAGRAGPVVARWRWWPFSVAGAAVTLAVLLASVGTDEARSLGRHLSSGRYIAESGLPKQDPFTVLGANQAWANPSWLFDLTVYVVYVAGGTAGLIIARLLCVAVLAQVLMLRAWRAESLTLALPVLVAVPAFEGGLNLSPTLTGMILVGLLAATLDRCEGQRAASAIARLAAIQVVWANTAPTFLLGPLVVALRGMGTATDAWSARSFALSGPSLRRYFLALLAVAIACCATPFGVWTLRSSWLNCFAAFAIRGDGQLLIPELAPLWSIAWSRPNVVAFAILSAAVLFAGIVPRIRCRVLFPAMFLCVLAVSDIRLIALAAVWLAIETQSMLRVACDPSGAAQTAPHRMGSTRWLLRAASVAAAVSVGGVLMIPARDGFRRLERQMRGATTMQARLRWLSQDTMRGTVLPLEPADAGWLVWGNPELKPVLDDRCELFAASFPSYRRLCLDVAQDRHNTYRRTDGSLGGWRRFANVVAFDWIAVRPAKLEPHLLLSSSANWGPVYWDADTVIFGPKQNEQVAAAARRLDMLRAFPGVEHITEHVPGTPESDLMILDEESWKNYTPREFVGLARVYSSLDLPRIAEYLVMRVEDARLLCETDEWLDGSRSRFRRGIVELQDAPRVEDRGSRTEDRGPRVEGRGSRVEDRGSRIEGGRMMDTR